MEINEVSGIVVDEAYKLHAELGPGLLESVYEVILFHRLQKRGLNVVRQVPIPIRVDGISFDEGFRADLIVDERIVVELKSPEQNHPVHGKQLLTYLKLTGKPLGLLINFGLPLLKDGVRRVVNNLPPESSLPNSS
jgi:iron complex transport system substrate-binding protein